MFSKISPWLYRRVPWSAVAAVIVVALTPIVVLAVDLFLDVPPSYVFYNDVNAIALAGITSGCGGGNYCPDATVTRGQMAAFMHRGFSRVTKSIFDHDITETADNPAATVGTATITVGLPAGALAGAAGFIEAHAEINLIAPVTGCPCEYWAALYDTTENSYLIFWYARQTVGNGEVVHHSVSGATSVQTTGVHTIQLRLLTFSGAATGAHATGDFVVSYHPFGGTGTNTLGPQPATPSAFSVGRTPTKSAATRALLQLPARTPG